MLNGFLLLLLWAIPVRYWYVCNIKGHCPGKEVSSPAPDESIAEVRKDLIVQLDEALALTGREQFVFDGVTPQFSADNASLLDSLAAYLQAHPDKTLLVTGVWLPEEEGKTSGFFENPGLARAAAIRAALVSRQVSEDRIGLAHTLSEDGSLSAPVRFELKEEAGVVAEAFTFTNMNFSGANFAVASAVFSPNSTFAAYADSLLIFMSLHPEKNLTITGHTDSKGSDELNNSLGLQRAESVKRYLQQKGLKSKIATRSAGASEPVASNDTEEGRARNRRVNLKIQ